MKKKLLVVVDMQNDFVTGSLGTKEAQAIIPKIAEEIKKLDIKDDLIFTRDTHSENYFDTLEGKFLPIEHCIRGTFGHEIVQPLLGWRGSSVYNKETFGCDALFTYLDASIFEYEEVHFCGVCTDICVVTNVLLARTALPNTRIIVHADMCSGTTPEKHKMALEVMKSCQIEVVGEGDD